MACSYCMSDVGPSHRLLEYLDAFLTAASKGTPEFNIVVSIGIICLLLGSSTTRKACPGIKTI